jgi:predicted nucleic acid-binding protein
MAAEEVVDQLDDLGAIFGNPLLPTPEWLHDAARVATAHRLTFHDAAWAAAARGLGVALVSTDRQLLDAGLAESPTAAARRLGLRIPEEPVGDDG